MCVVASNGDWFYQSFEPAVRSLLTAVRNFGQWGNTPISQNELRALAQNNRALMRFSSGINFDNRLLMAVLPQVASDGINVIHRAMLPLDFDVVSNLSTVGPTDVSGTSAMTPPVWEGALDGLNILQLFSGDFGGLPRAFATVISDVDGSINVWEITNSNRFENGDNRVLWSPEFPAFTWGTAGLEFKLKQLKGGELWVDKVAGRVDIEVYYRTDADPCWRRWFITDLCSARCEDYDSPLAVYPCEPFREGYKFPIVFPEPPPRSCDSMGVRPTTIGYQFQTKIMVRGWCRIRGLILYAIPHTDPQYHGIACPPSIPQGMAQLPRLIPSPFVPNVMSQFPPATLPPVPNADFTPPAPTPPTPGKNPPKQPINPTPLNGAVDVLNPILSWSDGGGATSYDVWFNGAFIGNQPGTTYNPGVLANSTPFTWRIDAVNADGTTTGSTWNFTTGVVVAFSYANPSLVINWVDSGGANSGTLAEFNILADQPTVTSLVFPASASITSITGLSSLPALTSITAAAGNIASLDLSGNPAIQTVDCHNDNSLTSLNLAGCVHLTTLQCGSCNGLTALDVHTCTALVTLSCNNCTTLAALNVTGLTTLTTLNCWTTALVTLDVHTCTALVTLDCHSTATLTSLLVVGCTSLVTLDCHSCALPDLHCDNLTALATLDCSHNSIAIAGFHITGCAALSNLNCSFNPLTSLDVSAFSLLATLLCTNDSIGPGGLNITGLANLVTLACQANNVGSLDVTASAATLQYLDCFGSGGNNIGTLNITGCTQLIAINCFSNTIGPLDFTGFTNLISVDCHFCPNVTTVTLTGCTALQNFQGYGSGLTALDVSTFAALTNVTCSAAALTTLNVTGCTALQILLLNGNPALTVLTGIGTCSALITLNAGSTGLTGTLDVSGFIHLTQLFMVNASTLATLDCHGCTVLNNLIITGCTGLTTLDCYSNPAIAGITGLTDCTALATFNCNTSGLTGFDNRVLGVPALTKLATIDVHNCTALAAFIVEGPFTGIGTTAINITGCSNLTAFYAVSWSLATFDISTCPLITTLNVGSNALTLVAVNTALFDLDSAGLINGHCYIALQTPARVPDAGPPDGATAKANLTGKGWAVTTD
jgi:Leucine-rich repeat (LRR) protein